MRHNLNRGFGCVYWKVTSPFNVFVRVAIAESNTWVGSSKALGNVYRRVEVKPGDEIHALPGGVFLVDSKGDVFEASLTVSDKHLFEKTYDGIEERWPPDKLTREPAPRKPESHTGARPSNDVWSFDRLKAEGAKTLGRSIDWILP